MAFLDDYNKVSSEQLYGIWKNLSVGLFTIVAVMTFSIVLPYYFSPIVALVAAAILYTVLYNNKLRRSPSCMLIPYAVFFCLISYSFISIVLNVLYIWGIIWLPKEFTFFYKPYLPSLMLDPICFFTLLIFYIRRSKLKICIDCKLQNGTPNERGRLGNILSYESHLQLKNLLILSFVLTVITWCYYLLVYVKNAEVNNRDWYIFGWLLIISFLIDELYFIFRYYNLYLDLKENDEIISEDELKDMTSKTYLRFYVICGNFIYLDTKSADAQIAYRHVIDSPFYTHRSVAGLPVNEVEQIAKRMTGIRDGELRFFFGRKSAELDRHSVLRYFYFLEGEPTDYPDLNVSGEWMNFEELKKIYNYNPGDCAPMLLEDITRMATIVLTQKTFDERGYRRNKIKSYKPSFNLKEVRKGNYDFQDDKWIRISIFNSDTRLYGLKRWWRNAFRGNKKKFNSWN